MDMENRYEKPFMENRLWIWKTVYVVSLSVTKPKLGS